MRSGVVGLLYTPVASELVVGSLVSGPLCRVLRRRWGGQPFLGRERVGPLVFPALRAVLRLLARFCR